MDTVFDDGLCTFFRTLAAEVGHTLFGDDDVDVMLRVVHVRNHRHDSRDFTFLGNGRTSEDGDIGIAGEVTASADAVHHLGSADVRGVHVAVDVGFDGGVDGDNTESAHHFRAVGDFRRTEHQLVAEEVHILVDAFQTVVRYGQ